MNLVKALMGNIADMSWLERAIWKANQVVPYTDPYDNEHIDIMLSATGSLLSLQTVQSYEEEHIETTLSATGALTRVYYVDCGGAENIEIALSAAGTLSLA